MALQSSKILVATAKVLDQKIVRRSANYHPTIWKDDYIQSLKSDYMGESYGERAVKLVGEVKMMLDKVMDPLEQLELVDALQRLGLSHHFENETKRILEYVTADHTNLYATSLEFRLLRQHGYKVTPEVFSHFMDEIGNLKAGYCEDWKGLLSLYEASYLLFEGESILEKARDCAAKQLKEYLKQNKDVYNVSMLVDHALELPLHWRLPRLETRWFIEVYQKREDRHQSLLDLAKLDFNMLQAVHQDDLRHASKWWKDLCLGEKLMFARDRVVECFLWAMGVATDLHFGNCRRILAKVGALITIIDDIYDVYGTMDELLLFTEAVERWDTNTMELFPEYMKVCFLALFNFVNETAFAILKEQGFDTLPLMKKMWADQCKAYLLEAKWYYNGYTPTLEEYLENGLISIAFPVILFHAYLATNSIRKECMECFEECSNLIKFSSVIARLANDLGTSSDELKRGDVPKSIRCYMHETGASDEEARQHIRALIDAWWKRLNEERFAHSPFSQTFIQFALNVPRMSQCMYQHGDGHGIGDRETKDRVLALIVFPIP
ncbi:(-)-alpha-terpineol synthase-like [Durio zibethinus]|uniref:(+)-delta-cadinene synthase n=1 Tax=Durio zibethinus TaxID=66656 RepID=A0A6P5ZDR1_DURZI|nr:(-)-alpha-terpineol synthase-like [Durio zibethinus]